ncbi:FAD-dependent oxidoreductase [Ideonella sp. DXS29W]|uniref:FAD-dependent oxidoreductase n=1 Tax=Ideonella lacteola TaxID=2984193 RepID=A0ABU9BPH8_9BURK
MTCSIDDGAAIDCEEGPDLGRVAYADLSMGRHRLTVRMGKTGAMSEASATWEIAAPDVVVVGATPGGISSALAAARAGRTVVVIESNSKIGGMMTGGLAKSDTGGGGAGEKALGGITREFFDRTRDREIAKGACSNEYPCPIYWDFEPHVAAEVFADMLAEQPRVFVQSGVSSFTVVRDGAQLKRLVTARGDVSAKVFIDASYEGDLMAQAGVSYTMIREPRLSGSDGVDPAGIEDDAGYGGLVTPPYGRSVDPFLEAGKPESGLLPFVEPPPAPEKAVGSADDKLMAYNYRLCVTDDPDNRIPFARPADYDPALYEGSARVAQAAAAQGKPLDELYFNPARTVRSTNPRYFKGDLNGGSAFSTDMTSPVWNQAYADASSAGRSAIEAAYRGYIEGLLYFWQTDPRFGALNAKVARYGLCRDEFVDNGHWPYRLYVRESRRMLGEYVMNENDVLRNGRRAPIDDGIAMGAYSADSHIRRITWATISVGGAPARPTVVTEGFRIIRLPGFEPYPIAYRSLLPRRSEVENLLNVGTLSATSMAYSSLRMEPTFMMIGQAAGTAASMAAQANSAVHDVDVKGLQARLVADGQIVK